MKLNYREVKDYLIGIFLTIMLSSLFVRNKIEYFNTAFNFAKISFLLSGLIFTAYSIQDKANKRFRLVLISKGYLVSGFAFLTASAYSKVPNPAGENPFNIILLLTNVTSNFNHFIISLGLLIASALFVKNSMLLFSNLEKISRTQQSQ